VDRGQELTAEEEELKELLESLARQHEILLAEQATLTIKSPLAGAVTTWEVAERLESRPVQRGQILLSVADLAGPWELDLRVAEDRIGHVLAERKPGQPLMVSFVLPGNPDERLKAKVSRISDSATTDDRGSTTVEVVAAIDKGALVDPRPGTSVAARIHCGRRPLGYVWLYGLWQAIRARVWW
jgi:hypothetical protein